MNTENTPNWMTDQATTALTRTGWSKARPGTTISNIAWRRPRNQSPDTLEGDANGAPHPPPSAYAKKFVGKYEHRTITGGIGHNLPQEAPQAFAQAVVDVHGFGLR
jgi:hypothetical protein